MNIKQSNNTVYLLLPLTVQFSIKSKTASTLGDLITVEREREREEEGLEK